MKKGYFLLGKADGEDLYVSLSDLSTHMHVLGATGSGKTLLFEPYELPLIKADTKFDVQKFTLNYALSYYTKRNFT